MQISQIFFGKSKFFLLFVFLLSITPVSSVAETQSSILIRSHGSIGSIASLQGWGGYITTTSYASQIMDTLHSEGRTVLRYWARPYWYYGVIKGEGASSKNFNKAIADVLVSKAVSYGMWIMIEPEHNWPAPDSAIIDNYTSQWINDFVTIAKYYKDYTNNVILQPMCEFGGNNEIARAGQMAQALRAAGIHNEIVFDLWWQTSIHVISDPDNNYGEARHLYLNSPYDHLTSPYNTLDRVKQSQSIWDSTTNSSVTVNLQGMMDSYFNGTNTLYVQRAKQLKIPLGFWIAGSGPAVEPTYLNNPTNIGIAYVMLLIRYAIKYNIPLTTYRIGDSYGESKHDLYQSLALSYFGESYFP